MMAKMKQSFYKNLPAIEDTENNIPPATGKIEKNAGDVLTGTAECAMLSVKGLNNPGQCGRCLRHGSNLRYKIATALYLADLREPACESTSGTSLTVLLTPYQVRLFCAGRNKPGKAGKSSVNGGRYAVVFLPGRREARRNGLEAVHARRPSRRIARHAQTSQSERQSSRDSACESHRITRTHHRVAGELKHGPAFDSCPHDRRCGAGRRAAGAAACRRLALARPVTATEVRND